MCYCNCICLVSFQDIYHRLINQEIEWLQMTLNDTWVQSSTQKCAVFFKIMAAKYLAKWLLTDRSGSSAIAWFDSSVSFKQTSTLLSKHYRSLWRRHIQSYRLYWLLTVQQTTPVSNVICYLLLKNCQKFIHPASCDAPGMAGHPGCDLNDSQYVQPLSHSPY